MSKGKGTNGRTTRPKVPMRRPAADCSVGARCESALVAVKRGNSRGAKGAGDQRGDRLGQLVTGGARWFRRKAAVFNGRASRTIREAYVRSRERLGVKIPGPTRRMGLTPRRSTRYAILPPHPVLVLVKMYKLHVNPCSQCEVILGWPLRICLSPLLHWEAASWRSCGAKRNG